MLEKQLGGRYLAQTRAGVREYKITGCYAGTIEGPLLLQRKLFSLELGIALHYLRMKLIMKTTLRNGKRATFGFPKREAFIH